MSGGGEGGKKVDMTYHLGSSDGPGNVTTHIQLRGENYDEWARAVRTSLKAKQKFGFVEGTIEKPTTKEKLEDWAVVHSMLVWWLTNTLEPSVRSTLGEYDDARLLWNNLKNHYCVVSGTRVCQLKLTLGECRQMKGESVAVYFGRLSKIWDELVLYVKVPKCKCGCCKCDLVGQVETLRYEDCLHCNRVGHDETTCFQIHGFPEWWGDRPRGGRGPGRGGGAGCTGSGRGRGRRTLAKTNFVGWGGGGASGQQGRDGSGQQQAINWAGPLG